MKDNWRGRRLLALLLAVVLTVSVVPAYSVEADGIADMSTVALESTGDGATACETCGEVTCVCESEVTSVAEDYSDSVNKYAQLNDYYFDGYVFVHDGSDSFAMTSAIFFEYADFEEDLIFQIVDWHLDSQNSALWYQVKIYGGTMPDGMSDEDWIFQNYTNENADEDTLLFVTIEETEDPEIPFVESTVTDSEGNEITDSEGNPIIVTVSGEALPEGASLSVVAPELDNQQLPRVFDIRVLDMDGNEWQPADYGQTVVLSIPVNVEDEEYVNILHVIDCANAVTDDVDIISAEKMVDVARPLFQSAIDAYGDGTNFAVQYYREVVVDGTVSIQTNSFSIYEWNSEENEYQEISDEEQIVTFRNFKVETLWGEVDLGDFHYYASPGQTFTLSTETRSNNSDPYIFDATNTSVSYTDESEILVNATNDYYYRQATVTIPGTAAPGQAIYIEFVGGGGVTGTFIVHVVREVTITFDKNLEEASLTTTIYEGVVTDGDTSKNIFTIPSSAEYTPTVPSGSRYVFKEWNTSPDGSGTSYQPGDSFTPLRDMTLYAVWDADNYFVSFNLMGGAGNIPEKSLYAKDTVIMLPEAPTKANVKFLGWSVTSDGYSAILPAGSKYTVSSDVTFYAIWGVDLTITVANGALTLQKAGEFVPSSLDEHTYQDGVTKIFVNQGTVDGVTTYTATLIEGYLENAIFFFAHSSSLNAAVASSNDAITVKKASTTQTQATVSSAGIAKTTTLTFNATQGQTYYISFDTAGGTAIAPIAKVQNATFSKEEITESTSKLGYTFGEWLHNGESLTAFTVTQNVTLTATWVATEYNLELDSNGGSESYSDVSYTIESETTLPTPTREGHTFAGWMVTTADGSWISSNLYSGKFSGMYGDAVLTAQWDINQYTITFVDADGLTKLHEITLDYGREVTAPDDPTKTGYMFSGWDTEIPTTMPADNMTITAKWEKITYQVTFAEKSGEGTGSVPEVSPNPWTFNIDSVPTEIPQPERVGYTFGGWYANEDCSGDAYTVLTLATELQGVTDRTLVEKTLYAKWTVNQHTVTFVDEDGTVLQSGNVPYGETPTYTGETPTKAATAQYTYTFAGWTPEIVKVTGDATYTATYISTVNEYTITWVNYDKSKLGIDKVAYGDTPMWSGTNPTYSTNENGYTWTGWDPEVTAVTGDATYTATYMVWSTITWKNWDGTVLETDEQVGTSVLPTYDSATPTRPADAQYTYAFDGWDPEVNSATKHVTYTAQYSASVNKYTVKFVDEDGTELQSGEVAYGETPTYTGETPTKAADARYTYTFSGWMPEIVSATGDATYTATYTATVNEYTIKFVDEDGTELQSGEVAYGEDPAYTGETPTKESTAEYTYTFAGWTPEIAVVTGEATYTATYSAEVNEYTIKFVDEDGTVLQSVEVAYGETPTYTGETPTKESTAEYTHTFAGWTPEIAVVTGEATYTATYTETANLTTLTIKVAGSADVDKTQYYIFDVVEQDGSKVTVTVQDNGTAVIYGVTIGNTYTVTMQGKWSWRYGEVIAQSVQIEAGGSEVSFTVTRTNAKWLDGNDFKHVWTSAAVALVDSYAMTDRKEEDDDGTQD